MDAENGELFLGRGGDGGDGGVTADWTLDAPFCSELLFDDPRKPLQDWAVDPDCVTHDSESDDVLHAVDPNEVFPTAPSADTSSESDSGISEDPAAENPVAPVTEAALAGVRPPTVFQVVYDIGGLRGVKAEPVQENVIAIELDEWSSRVLFSDSCVVNELPVVAAVRQDDCVSVVGAHSPDDCLLVPDLQLTEEEQKLLSQEGVSLPNNLPLTKAEERILKKVRRKIRNKQSAQDSRRRRKEYIDGLESRAAACSAQNRDLQKSVDQLERRNLSLLTQLRQLQSLIKQTVSKGAQTSTCLLIILVSLGLIILPSFSPFHRDTIVDEDYRPIGVISRNILTDPASSQPTADKAESSLSLSPPTPLSQSGGGGRGGVADPIETAGMTAVEGNRSAAVAEQTLADVAVKPAHADEM